MAHPSCVPHLTIQTITAIGKTPLRVPTHILAISLMYALRLYLGLDGSPEFLGNKCYGTPYFGEEDRKQSGDEIRCSRRAV